MESSCNDDNSTRTPPQLSHEQISNDTSPVLGDRLCQPEPARGMCVRTVNDLTCVINRVIIIIIIISLLSTQGWVFAMAKTIFARTVEENGKNRGKTGKIWCSYFILSMSYYVSVSYIIGC